MLFPLSRRITRVYEKFDSVIQRLPDQFGIHCPPGCGSCCASPKVEATVLEMLPLSESLWETGKAEPLLQQYAHHPFPAGCLFFTPDELHFNHGRCSVYPFRPTLCRLFGFAAVRNKHGHAEFAACRFMKEIIPDAVLAVQSDVDNGGEILRFTEAAGRIAEIEPSLNLRFPINEALFFALERIGMHRQLTNDNPDPAELPDTEPPLPSPFKQCS